MTSRRKYLALIGLIAAALVGAVLLAVPGSPIHRKPTLGLDLQGGLEVVLKAEPPKGHKLTQDDLNRAKDIIENRINKLGVSEPDVRVQQPDQIVIQLAGVHNPAAAAQLIGSTAQLQFFDFENDVVGPSRGTQGQIVATPTLYGLLSQVQPKHLSAANVGPYYLFRAKTVTTGTGKKKQTVTKHSLVAGPLPTQQELLRPYHGKAPAGTQVLAVPPGRTVVSCAATTGCLGAQVNAGTYYYLLKYDPNSPNGPPELTGKDLQLSGTQADFDPTTGLPIVTLAFTSHGSSEFEKITREEYDAGRTAAAIGGHGGDKNYVSQYARHFAIVLDGEIRSTPYIDYTDPSLAGGISGNAQISNIGTIGEAKNLALVLQTGALPVKFNPIERTDVSATLGKDSLRQAWHAAAIGLGVVALFLLLLYRFLGLVAVIGLGIYAAFYYAALLLFGVTLTLPGFAGLILTIGVAADANVVIFERIKEEVRAGKSVRAAVSTGYGKGFHTIIDANVVTAITALILFAVATAEVKGFALMLLIGTVISLITAVAATRAMLGLLAGFRWFGNAGFMGAAGAQKGRFLQIDFMRRRYLWFAISGVVILVSAVSLGVRGLNFGIDFKGGSQVDFSTPKPVAISKVRAQAADIGRSDAVVQGRGTAYGSGGDQYKQYQLRMKSLTGAQQSRLDQDLRTNLGAKSIGVQSVSSSFGRQIAHDAILAIIVSLFLIVVYIAVRFDLKFAGPVIGALLHDIVITVGVYSLVGREVSTSTVAAVLTVLGYSIYDTIIIFDRVRENVPLMRRSPFATIVNVSLWETIRRSLATTFITLLPVAALMAFGGATLKDFAFALLVGITSGAYSSIFIAAPLLTILKEREPEYRRRIGKAPEELATDGRAPALPRRRREKVAAVADAGTLALEESEQALAAEPAPPLLELTPEPAGAQARREKRRQRRRTRPHGRAR